MNHIGSLENDSSMFEKLYISKKGTHVRTVRMGGYALDIPPLQFIPQESPRLKGWGGGGGGGLGRMGGETDVGESRQTILILF